MQISTEEKEIIEKILNYQNSGKTDMISEVMLNPVNNYSDPVVLEEEVNILFRNFPIIIGHVGEVASPGQFITHNETGVPILVTRNYDNQIKAFINVCRHRGAKVTSETCGHAKTFSCPYHGWTYDLNGTLRGIPQPFGFEGLDKNKYGLVELAAYEQFGLIWVVPSVQKKDIDIISWLKPMEEQLKSLNLCSYKIFRKWSVPLKMNWRIALEGFQESYHFCSAHKDTACSGYLNNQSVFIDHYPHVRHSVPLWKVGELKDVPINKWDYRNYFMTQNFIFPANFIQVMTDHVYVHSIIPTSVSECIFKCIMLIPDSPRSEKEKRYWEKNYEVINTVFGEDFKIGEGIQMGLATGVNEDFVFGMYECGLHLSQKAIDDAISGRLSI